jgi:hypothetical protein
MEQERERYSVVAVAAVVVAVECVAGNSKAEEWGGFGGVAQEGDAVAAARIGVGSGRGAGGGTCWRPYGPGCTRLCTPAFRRRDTSVELHVHSEKDLHACILPNPSVGRKQHTRSAPCTTPATCSGLATASSDFPALQGNPNSSYL